MKVFLHYEDNPDKSLHKSLKITLPKSWKNGPTSKLLAQFVESYNATDTIGAKNPLDASQLHLAIRTPDNTNTNNDNTNNNDNLTALASDAITIQVIQDREDVYIRKGPSQTLTQIQSQKQAQLEQKRAERANTVACTHFGCNNRFPPGGPYPNCRYHAAPPVFHETAKFWSCCPQKKAYDWDDFQAIPGCQVGTCTQVKEGEDRRMQFLGGCDLRETLDSHAPKLKSIDEFNTARGQHHQDESLDKPLLERLQSVLVEIGVEEELFCQVVNGIQKDVATVKSKEQLDPDSNMDMNMDLVVNELGNKLKNAFKNIAVDQLRIK